MKMDFNKFLDIFYALLKIDEIDCIDLNDIYETIKIIYSSEDFDMVSTRFDFTGFDDDMVLNNKYTKEIDENGNAHFDINDKETMNVINNNKMFAGLIEQAINKRAMTKLIKEESNGLVEFKYDSPNGAYNLPYINNFQENYNSVLFTDGDITKNVVIEGEEQTYTRNVKIDNATYSIMVTLLNNYIDTFDVRALYYADYNFVYSEIKRLLGKGYNTNNDLYNEVITDLPKVYKFKRH